MIDRDGPARLGRGWRGRLLVARLARSWVLRVLAGLFVVALIGAGLYVDHLYRAAFPAECDTLPDLDPSMDELIDLRARLTAYQQDPSPDAVLSLTGRELSVLFGDKDDFHLRVAIQDDRAAIRMTVPAQGGCWNVQYDGRLRVRDGQLVVAPDRLVVGEAALTPFLSGRSWTVVRRRIPDATIARMIANTRTLDLHDGLAEVRLDNRWDVW